jgi:branched-chain amino acid transport system substrate-binding protein
MYDAPVGAVHRLFKEGGCVLKSPLHDFRMRLVSLLLGITVILAVSACSTTDTTGNTTLTSGTPIKIGTSLPITGSFSQDGAATKKGYLLWQDYINSHGGLLGRPVQFDIKDNKTDLNKTLKDYQDLIKVDHVDLVVGPFADEFTVRAAAAVEPLGYPMVNGTGVAPTVFTSGHRNIFSVSLPAANTLSSFVLYTLSLPFASRPKTAAYATEADPYLSPIVHNAEQQLTVGGITQVFPPYGVNDIKTDYDPAWTQKQWDQLADKIIAANPDVVVLGTATGDAVEFVKHFKAKHFNPKLLVEVSGPDQGAQFTDPIGGTNVASGIFVPNGGWFPGINTFGEQDFEQAYIAKNGGDAGGISGDAVQAWSAMQVLQQAVEKVQSLDKKIIMNELRTDIFRTIQGTVQFNSDGSNADAVPFLFQWQGGNLIPVYPVDNAQALPLAPKPSW